MPLNIERARQLLRAFDLQKLFIEEMGWDQPGPDLHIQLDGTTHTLVAVAQKRGVAALVWQAADGAPSPDHRSRRRIEAEVRKRVHEHLIVFANAECSAHTWQWVRRVPGQPAVSREWSYVRGQSEEPLLARLQGAVFEFEEEEGLTVGEVAGRVRATFDVERVTRRFYDQFKREHDTFLRFLKGIPDQGLARWYVSVTLNRLMFIYFVQKKQFLDDDPDYLRTKLAQSQQRGRDRFYRDLLCPLFFEGFARLEAERSLQINRLLGKVPYLNGGIFARHELEERFGQQIQIADQAFAHLFDFFDQYRWHLDERPLRADNEINPDVLGYIFEKYINQKQMGAYYTKEDITGYISKYTVLPYLLDQVQKQCRIAFAGESSVWRLLAADPERYIYPALGHGIAWDARQAPPRRLDAPLALPPEIAAGVKSVAERGGWNTPAPEPYALPTEIWREVVARRQRYEEVRRRLAQGEAHEVDDLITLNLDIQQFAQDVIEGSEGPELVRAFWKALKEVKVLDPTCGSGAFLFAALNILEPLYQACLDRMQGLLGELERSGAKHRPEKLSDFRHTLEEMARHTNRRYFILKTIIVHNLYGVDIMEEAVEICRLRLFLKLVAQLEKGQEIEPLPDIDFNVRAGNTLVGFTSLEQVRTALTTGPDGQPLLMPPEENLAQVRRIEEDAEIAHRAYLRFQQQQTEEGWVTAADKAELRDRLDALNKELNRALARTYHVDPDGPAHAAWLASHKPFHWWGDFYGIMTPGGFDAIVGNPPYFDLKQGVAYSLKGYATLPTKNLYPLVLERSTALATKNGRLGFIVPVSSISTEGYARLQELVLQLPAHFSSYDDRPSRLFEGLEHIQLTIHLLENSPGEQVPIHVTECYRWSSVERPYLFPAIEYETVQRAYLPGCVPKFSTSIERSILSKLWMDCSALGSQFSNAGRHKLFYSRKVHNFLQAVDFIPRVYDGSGKLRAPSELKALGFHWEDQVRAAFCVLNSTLFRWFINVFSDCRHVNKREVEGFRCDIKRLLEGHRAQIVKLADALSASLASTAEYREMRFRHDHLRIQCIIPKYSKPIIDEIDRMLAQHYGFTDEELDFIINYHIKYRMGLDDLRQEGEA